MSEVPRFKLTDNSIVELRYYGVRVFSSNKDRQKLESNKSLARLIIFLGLCLVLISGIDLSILSSTLKTSEQSIWPSSGKGIWIGLFVIGVGVFTLIAVREQTHSSFQIIFPYIIVALILCFFGLLTSISVLQRYLIDPYLSIKENRNKEQGIQFALHGLLIGIFSLTFLFLSCLSCLMCWTIPKFCQKYEGPNPTPFIQPPQRIELKEYPLRRPQLRHLRPSYPTNRSFTN